MGGPEGGWWYNTRSGEVERGPQSLGLYRVGPFATEAEAANAPQTLRARSEAWAAEDEAEAEDR
ncbi:methionine aminopeptidase [Leucobacter sp. M11]|nr:methionine aminopeptidase [Leucobacter sp. M11]